MPSYKANVPSRVQWRHLDDVAAQNDDGRLAVTCGKGSTASVLASNGWVRFVESTAPQLLPRSGGRIRSSFASGWEITDAGRAALARARSAYRADRPRPTTAQKLGPLRRVVAEGTNKHGVATETLECGHTILRKSDIYGPTNAYRRRCRHCRDGGDTPPKDRA
jgi:hypothetical protein